MRTKNLTIFPFGYKVTARQPPQLEMSFVVRAALVLKPGSPCEPVRTAMDLPEYMDELDGEGVELLDNVAQGSTTGDGFADDGREGQLIYPSDFADFKPTADVMLRGSCHPDRETTQCVVSFGVGDWLKELKVIGPRVWVDRILGGKTTDPLPFKSMPVDYAHAFGGPQFAHNPIGMGHKDENLPNIEHVDGRDPQKSPEPAGFAPINPAWPLRDSLRGKNYGEQWELTRAPFYSDDFDWRYFQAAPPSQRMKSYLRGDETLRFANLHPDAARFEAKLPGIRIRVFVKDVEGNVHTIAMKLDTLFADLEDERLYLSWRGLCKAKQDDLTDMEFALIAQESLSDEPLADEHYIEQLNAYADDPVGLKDVFDGDPDELVDQADDPPPGDTSLAGVIDGPVGRLPEEQREEFTAALEKMIGQLPEDFDLEKQLAEVQANSGVWRATPGKPGDEPNLAGVPGLSDALAQAKEAAAGSGGDTSRLDELEDKLKSHGVNDDPEPELGPGVDLSGRDLSGRDLSGVDLSGAKCHSTNFSSSTLRGANLSGADLECAQFYKAELSDANLSGAKLDHAELTLARAPNANFNNVSCSMTVFRRTDLTGADMSGAHGSMCIFSKVEMVGARLRGMRLEQASMARCEMEKSDWKGASLVRVHLDRCNAPGASFVDCELSHTSFERSAINDTDFAGATGEMAIFQRTNLERANFSYADLPDAQFHWCNAKEARFFGANLRQARFDRAGLRAARLESANLFGADFRKAVLSDARFRKANLYDAKFYEAHGTNCDMSGANLDKANFQRSHLVRK